ncbi:P-loop containing nucleoside triphosphate hydrolase protein [Gongronella butleri]|nr:P-loop containing nucleoside triphosphate hydrolase protein [Gongronella butleri]
MDALIDQLAIRPAIEAHGLDVDELVVKAAGELSRLLKIDEGKAVQLREAACHQVYPWRTHITTLSDLPTTRFVSLHDPKLDSMLTGGVPLGSITEIVGESSSGKTQLCMQMCFTVQKPRRLGGLGGEAVYIHNEGKFSSTRCAQLASWYGGVYGVAPEALTSKIHVKRTTTTDQLFALLAYQVPLLLEKHADIKVVIVDSLGAAYRGGGGGGTETGGTGRHYDNMAELCDIGLRLKRLAHTHQVAVVVVNQVMDAVNNSHEARAAPSTSSSSSSLPDHVHDWLDMDLPGSSMAYFVDSLAKVPTLGLTWANAVTTRLRMARATMMDGRPTRRALFVEFSPLVPRSGVPLLIDDTGIHALI